MANSGKSIGPFRNRIGKNGECSRGSGRQTACIEQSASGESQNPTPILLPVRFHRPHRGHHDAVEPQPAEELFHQTGFARATFTFQHQSAGPAIAARLGRRLGQTGQLHFPAYQW